uniref:TTR protein n=1 Tax=Homo sapiens TaxID=9606 RepID=Q13736_HUMAN|nr:ORF1 [Homo sapiens]
MYGTLHLFSNSTQMETFNKATVLRGPIFSLKIHYTHPWLIAVCLEAETILALETITSVLY